MWGIFGKPLKRAFRRCMGWGGGPEPYFFKNWPCWHVLDVPERHGKNSKNLHGTPAKCQAQPSKTKGRPTNVPPMLYIIYIYTKASFHIISTSYSAAITMSSEFMCGPCRSP